MNFVHNTILRFSKIHIGTHNLDKPSQRPFIFLPSRMLACEASRAKTTRSNDTSFLRRKARRDPRGSRSARKMTAKRILRSRTSAKKCMKPKVRRLERMAGPGSIARSLPPRALKACARARSDLCAQSASRRLSRVHNAREMH